MPVRHSIVSVQPTAASGDTTVPGTPVITLDSQVGLFATFHTDHTPGDDGFAGATADSYRMAFSAASIDTEAEWLAAQYFEPAWTTNVTAANAAQDFTVEFMITGTYYVAIRFRDTAGNVGGISNSVAVTL